MTNTYDTSGQPLGSTSAKVLYNNASNFDEGVNSPGPSFTDRFGLRRETWRGMQTKVEDFIAGMGFVFIGDYAAGLTFTNRGQYTVRLGIAYHPNSASPIPYTTTGVWATDEVNFVAFNADTVLRSDLAQNDGGINVGFIDRTVDAKLRDRLTVEDFGAIGDGVFDCTSAINAAALTGSVILGRGTYLYTGVISSVNQAFAIEGVSKAESVIKFTGVGGIDFSSDSIYTPLTVQDVTLLAAVASAGTAIKGVWPAVSSASNVTCHIENVQAIGTAVGSTYWNRFSDLTEAWNAFICKNLAHGGGYATASDLGIVLRGRSIDVICNENRIYSFGKGVASLGLNEGLQMHSNVLIAVGYGLYSDHDAVTPAVYCIGNHISSYLGGIYAANTPQSFYDDNLIYQIGATPSVQASYVGINLRAGSHISKMTSNHMVFLGGPLNGGTGFVINGSDGCSGSDNSQQGGNTVMWAQPSASNYTLVNNRANDTGVLVVLAEGTGENVLTGNKPVASFSALTANSAAPSVANSPTNVFITGNTLATNVNTFAGGISGQTIEVLANDTATTIVHGLGIILKGAINFPMPNGAVLTLRNYGNVWREVSRST